MAIYVINSSPKDTVLIYSDNKLVRTINLSKEKNTEIRIENGSGGYNIITVSDGEVYVSEANCENHICVDSGKLTKVSPIACVPNGLVIMYGNSDDEYDLTLGGE